MHIWFAAWQFNIMLCTDTFLAGSKDWLLLLHRPELLGELGWKKSAKSEAIKNWNAKINGRKSAVRQFVAFPERTFLSIFFFSTVLSPMTVNAYEQNRTHKHTNTHSSTLCSCWSGPCPMLPMRRPQPQGTSHRVDLKKKFGYRVKENLAWLARVFSWPTEISSMRS